MFLCKLLGNAGRLRLRMCSKTSMEAKFQSWMVKNTSREYWCESQSPCPNNTFISAVSCIVKQCELNCWVLNVQVDHSIVESFAQGGRSVITSRVYPTEAIYGAARLFLFNNATGVNVKATLKIWQLNSAFIHPFPLDQIQ